MKYSKLLYILYGDSLSDILNILNQSVYVTDYITEDKNSIVVHTGFTFLTHKQKKIDLLYDFKNETIIRQVRNDGFAIPQINGMFATKGDDNYFNYFCDIVLTEIVEEKDEESTFYHLKNPYTYLNINKINEITVIDKEKNNEITYTSFKISSNGILIKEIPLQKELEDIIFFDGDLFKKYISDDEYYQEEDDDDYDDDDYDDDYHDYDRDTFNALTDGQLGDYDDFGGDIDDVMTWLGRD